MNKLKKNNIVKFPEVKVTDQEKEIEAIHGTNTINKKDCIFDSNAWSNRDRKKIKANGNKKKMDYWVQK